MPAGPLGEVVTFAGLAEGQWRRAVWLLADAGTGGKVGAIDRWVGWRLVANKGGSDGPFAAEVEVFITQKRP